MSNNKTARITINEKNYDLDILKASKGSSAINITDFQENSGYIFYDEGLSSTAFCKSSITYIDGQKPILSHYGHDIKDLTLNYSYIDVMYLLLYKKLPPQNENTKLERELVDIMINFPFEKIISYIELYDRKTHPMSILIGSICFLSSVKNQIHKDINNDLDSAKILISFIFLIVGMINRYISGKDYIKPKKSLGFMENFLFILSKETCFSKEGDELKINADSLDLFNKLFILHIDHEQNASTSTLRMILSTDADLFSAVSGAFSSLSGKKHGGANQEVIEMLESISNSKEINIDNFIDSVKNKKNILMGFGHRIYKNYDPRAYLIKEKAIKYIKNKTIDNHKHNLFNKKLLNMLNIALSLEEKALADDYFISRKLFPNVDFYSGLIYKANNIPNNMFTLLFASARSVGMTSHWLEFKSNKNNKILRPRQVYN